MGLEDDEYHAYLIISLETRTMVIHTLVLALQRSNVATMLLQDKKYFNYTDNIDITFSLTVPAEPPLS